MEQQLYSTSLGNYILANKSIPRILKQGEHLKLYHKYWLDNYGAVKVQDIFIEKGTEYYIIRYSDRMSSCIPYPATGIYTFELLHNSERGMENEDVINSGQYYTGAEIRYWFYINDKIKKFADIFKYLSYTSDSALIDNKLYKVTYNNHHIKFIEKS